MNAPDNPGSNRIVIGLGSNINPEDNLKRALQHLSNSATIQSCSGVWQNPAVGSSGPDYLNAAVLITTELSPAILKDRVLCRIEQDLERVRKEDKNADRTIDLDILAVNGIPLDGELWTRPHVSVPAAEVAPELENTETGERLADAARRLHPERDFNLRPDLNLPAICS